MLQTALTAVSRTIEPAMWQNHAALEYHLRQQSAANALFSVVLASDAHGQIVVRMVNGKPSAELPNISDRPYFQKAIKSDQLVVSEPIIGRVSKMPLVLLALAAPKQDGQPTGLIAGSLALGAAGLFSNIGQGDLPEGARSLHQRQGRTRRCRQCLLCRQASGA